MGRITSASAAGEAATNDPVLLPFGEQLQTFLTDLHSPSAEHRRLTVTGRRVRLRARESRNLAAQSMPPNASGAQAEFRPSLCARAPRPRRGANPRAPSPRPLLYFA